MIARSGKVYACIFIFALSLENRRLAEPRIQATRSLPGVGTGVGAAGTGAAGVAMGAAGAVVTAEQVW